MPLSSSVCFFLVFCHGFLQNKGCFLQITYILRVKCGLHVSLAEAAAAVHARAAKIPPAGTAAKTAE